MSCSLRVLLQPLCEWNDWIKSKNRKWEDLEARTVEGMRKRWQRWEVNRNNREESGVCGRTGGGDGPQCLCVYFLASPFSSLFYSFGTTSYDQFDNLFKIYVWVFCLHMSVPLLHTWGLHQEDIRPSGTRVRDGVSHCAGARNQTQIPWISKQPVFLTTEPSPALVWQPLVWVWRVFPCSFACLCS